MPEYIQSFFIAQAKIKIIPKSIADWLPTILVRIGHDYILQLRVTLPLPIRDKSDIYHLGDKLQQVPQLVMEHSATNSRSAIRNITYIYFVTLLA